MERIYGGEAKPGTSSDRDRAAVSGDRLPLHRYSGCGAAALGAGLVAVLSVAVMMATATVVEPAPVAAPTALRVWRAARARGRTAIEMGVTIGAPAGAAYRVTALAPPARAGDGARPARVLVGAPSAPLRPLDAAAPTVMLDTESPAVDASEIRLQVAQPEGALHAGAPVPLVVEVTTQHGDVFTTYRLTALVSPRETTAAARPPEPAASILAR
jgi:hypothetical protein